LHGEMISSSDGARPHFVTRKGDGPRRSKIGSMIPTTLKAFGWIPSHTPSRCAWRTGQKTLTPPNLARWPHFSKTTMTTAGATCFKA
jgi:hypothetical protein